MKIQVDLIVKNAKVYTVDDKNWNCDSFAVKNGLFEAVGFQNDILSHYEATQTIDAQGQSIFPGFIDAHCHFFGLGMTMQQVNLVGTKSLDDVLLRVQAFYNQTKSTFVCGRGWNQNEWAIKTFPTKEKLDALFPDIPVALNRIDGHAMLANQAALDLAGIDCETTIAGGEIEQKDNQLTGILIDNAMYLVYKVMPKVSEAQQRKALLDAEKACFTYGLTSVQDAELSQNIAELMLQMHTENALNMRIYTMILATDNALDFYLKNGKVKTDKLHIGAFKIYMDGALGSMGAYMKNDYEKQNGKRGALVCSEKRLKEVATKVKDSAFQLNVHAIGDAANHIVLKTFVDDLNIAKDRRWRIEHAQIVDKADMHYFEKVMPSVQPTHATSDMYWAATRLGKERIKNAYAYKDLLEKHHFLPLGTDFPIEEINPMLTFYAAVSRQDVKGYPENGFQSENAITKEEALKGMTIWAAYAAFEENEKGSITAGKHADFVILDQDMMTIPIHEVPKTKVLKTFLGGEVVFG